MKIRQLPGDMPVSIFHAKEKLQQFLCLARFMPLVIAPENAAALRFDDQRLHRGRTDVQSCVITDD